MVAALRRETNDDAGESEMYTTLLVNSVGRLLTNATCVYLPQIVDLILLCILISRSQTQSPVTPAV